MAGSHAQWCKLARANKKTIDALVVGPVTLIDESVDTSNYLTFANDPTGVQALKTNTGLSYNADTNALTATTFIGDLVGSIPHADTATLAATATVALALTGPATPGDLITYFLGE